MLFRILVLSEGSLAIALAMLTSKPFLSSKLLARSLLASESRVSDMQQQSGRAWL